ncbi:MAG TPA: DivIVA domain-containing protein [Candidatus Avacidaminococcus intestinavium]|uniref:DivIVA domain-containing protein n=1 Tax=Candidatus Avacidaminococcus intestinavium TaxID=2840684 RepID=A0A9D1SKP0_9FIRM|nr:DivIVA domain-containing protein [Candidatus Avacidaminococcus intestinavium]
MLTPLDLHGKKFNKEFRGYDSKEVDTFFAQVVKDFERLYQDNIELKEALERAATKLEYFEQMEATMHSTLAIAQETAEEVKQSGKKQVELLIKESAVERQRLLTETENTCKKMTDEAEAYCKKINSETEEKCSQMLKEAEEKVQAAERAYKEQVRLASTHRTHMRTLLEGQLELMRKAEKEHF